LIRVAWFLLTVVALALAGYLAITGWFVANTSASILTAGPLATALAQADQPEDPLEIGYRGTPMTALGLPFETVSIETPLGPAEAWLIRSAGPEKGRAIVVHGIAGTKENGFRHLSMLNEAGWTVLLVTYRNHDHAPPAPDGRYAFGLAEWADLEAAVAWLVSDAGGPGLLVVADSMGAAVLGQFLARSPLADRVVAVALDSPAISFAAVTEQLARLGGYPLAPMAAWVAGRVLPRITGLPLDEAEVAGVFQAFPGPMFISHGGSDRIVPIGPSQALAEARPAPTTTLWTTADHLGSFAEDPAAYRSAFRDFLGGIGG
jgi:alpha-beta hydrolase superfamily lysophospholipase